jgi:hypothetical protein
MMMSNWNLPPGVSVMDEHINPSESDDNTFCVWEDCDQEAQYCHDHAYELVNPLQLKFAPPALDVFDGVMSDKSQDADWLRARFFERSAEVEVLEKRIAELEAVAKEAAKWLNNDPKRTYSALGEALSKLEEKP